MASLAGINFRASWRSIFQQALRNTRATSIVQLSEPHGVYRFGVQGVKGAAGTSSLSETARGGNGPRLKRCAQPPHDAAGKHGEPAGLKQCLQVYGLTENPCQRHLPRPGAMA